jgi:bifunctional non-homologous end joining protein LigD
MATLRTYRAKRDFGKTPEPRGAKARKQGHRYVIQKHAATRLHYDLRLELDGVMLSWAITRGPSLVPGDKRLAIHVEDHPIEYNTFEGVIPKGEYGGGTVMVWDRGHWTPDGDPHRALKKGHLDFVLDGEKLKGRWHLVRMHKRPGEKQEPWLLIKATDEYAHSKSDPDVLEEMPNSAATGRTMEEIAEQKKKVWHSNKPARTSKLDRLSARFAKTKAVPRRGSGSASPARPPVSGSQQNRKKTTTLDIDLAALPGVRKQPQPDFVEPTLATLASAPPSSAEWVHEIKFDGYRIQAWIAGGTVTLRTRTGLDWTKRFPPIAEACAALAPHDAILDGEIVSGDKNGVSDFSALQDDLKSGRFDRLVCYVFDILYLDGYDLTGTALVDRKRVLKTLLGELPGDDIIKLSDHFETDGSVMLKHACEMSLEGIVSKQAHAPYRSGRVGNWLKTKCSHNQEFVVIGYEPSDKNRRTIRSLLLGYYEGGKLRYAGRVGTGWNEKEERELSRRFAPLARDRTPLDTVPDVERRQKVAWLEPRTVVEIDFRGWTRDKLVRQASYQGVREDKPAADVVREVERAPEAIRSKQAALQQKPQRKTRAARPRSPEQSGAVAFAGVTLTHPDRIYWEDVGVTKRMLAEHYEQVWDWMQPHVTRRVLALVRCPDGTSGQCFFQKHASAGIEEKWLRLVPEPDGDKSIAIDDLPGLISLAQAGALELHMRGSTIDHLEEADRLVFDLDPGPGVGWPTMIAAAREVRQRLNDLKLESFVKTTGGKGLHVVLPIRPASWDEAKDFCRRVAETMARDSPGSYTATIRKSARNNRIFVDYLRNSREATAIAPYSTRARPGATVATPLTWQELGSQKAPNAFTLQNLGKRLARLRDDPWKEIGRIKQRLPRK